MKKDVSFKMIASLLGLMLMTESCSCNKNHQMEPIYQEDMARDDGNDIEDCDSDCLIFIPDEFESNLSDLFGMHGQLLDDAMTAILTDPTLETVKKGESNLFVNAHEIAVLLGTIYGSHVAYRFEILLDQQIRLFSEYIQAIRFQNKSRAKCLLVRAYANGDLLVEFLNIMNPFFAYKPEKYLMDENVTIVSNQAAAYFKGDLEEADKLRIRLLHQLMDMAGHLSKAIQSQMADLSEEI